MSDQLQNILAILSGLIALASAIPYIWDTAKGKTKPNVVTWFTWTLLNAINAAAAFSDGAAQTGIFSVFAAIATATILVFGLNNGFRKYTRFDVICQIVALCGIPLWLTTNEPLYAVLFVLIVDIAGGLPTLRHAWVAPNEETLRTFVISAAAFVPLFLSFSEYTFVGLAMPSYIFLYDITLICLLIYRQRLSRGITKVREGDSGRRRRAIR